MLDFIKSDVSIKKLAHSTVDQLASYSLDQLKGIIAKALTDDWNKTLAAKEVKKIFSDNELFVSSEKATSKLFWCEMISVLAQYYFWNKPIKQLDRDGNEVVEGVDEVLSNGDGGDTVATVKSLEQDTWVGADEETSTYGGEGTVVTVKDETVINEETTYKGIPCSHLTKTEYQNSNHILWYAPPKEDELTITSNSRFYSVRYKENYKVVMSYSLLDLIPVIKQWVGVN